MKKTNWPYRLRLGVSNHPWRFLATLVTAYLALWKLYEPIVGFFDSGALRGWPRFAILLVGAIVIGSYWAALPNKADILLKNTSCGVTVCFGDFFSMSGNKLIPVNEFFDSEIGNLVSLKSLHGQFIQRELGGLADTFDRLVEPSLKKFRHVQVARPKGKQKRYPIGTTVVADVGGAKYFLVASAHTDLSTNKAHMDIPDFWEAFDAAWTSIRIHGGGDRVVVPLIGGGRAGIGLPHKNLLQLVLSSILYHTKKWEIGTPITIVIPEEQIDSINLTPIKEVWST